MIPIVQLAQLRTCLKRYVHVIELFAEEDFPKTLFEPCMLLEAECFKELEDASQELQRALLEFANTDAGN